MKSNGPPRGIRFVNPTTCYYYFDSPEDTALFMTQLRLLSIIPIPEFSEHHRLHLEQCLLLQDDEGCNGLMIASRQHTLFHSLLDRISPQVRDIALLMPNKAGQHTLSLMILNKEIDILRRLSEEPSFLTALLKEADGLPLILNLLCPLAESTFLQAINHLGKTICNQLALCINQEKSGLHFIIENKGEPCFQLFFTMLSRKTISQVLFMEDQQTGYTTFHALVAKYGWSDFLKERIKRKDCNRFALLFDKNGTIGLGFVRNGLIPFLNRLDIDVRFSALLATDKLGSNVLGNALSGMLMLWVRSDKSGFKRFLIKHPDYFSPEKIKSYRLSVYIALYPVLPRDTINQFNNHELDRYCQLLESRFPEEHLNFISFLPVNRLIDIGIRRIFNQTKLPQHLLRHVVTSLSQYPEGRAVLSDHVCKLSYVRFWDGGLSEDNWSALTNGILKLLPAPKARKPEADLSNYIVNSRHRTILEQPEYLVNLEKRGWKFTRIQGRTILLQNNYQEVLAVKIQKKGRGETVAELIKEFETTDYLKAHASQLGLKSDLPTVITVLQIANVYDWLRRQTAPLPFKQLEEFVAMIGDEDCHYVYVYHYKIPPTSFDYSTYLHDSRLSEEQFNVANEIVVHDLYTLFKRGVVFPQLGDIFHNLENKKDKRDDKGRYRVLANLLNDRTIGSGRLTGWKEAVAFPNLRASGIADVGDFVSINDFLAQKAMLNPYFLDVGRSQQMRTGNYLLANIMAEYQYILFLIAGRWAVDKTATMDKTSAEVIWLNAADRLIKNCAQAVSLLSLQSRTEAEKILFAIIKVDRLAAQMQYWMTTDYIDDLNQNKIRANLYGPDVKVSVDNSQIRKNTFNTLIGCSINGKTPDLGMVNGQEPIKEGDALRYWMVILIFTGYQQFATGLSDLRKVIKEKNFSQSERLRRESFAYFPRKNWHFLQQLLCEERLKQTTLPAGMTKKLKKEIIEHKENCAALTIQGFWRQQRRHTTQGSVENTAIACCSSTTI